MLRLLHKCISRTDVEKCRHGCITHEHTHTLTHKHQDVYNYITIIYNRCSNNNNNNKKKGRFLFSFVLAKGRAVGGAGNETTKTTHDVIRFESFSV